MGKRCKQTGTNKTGPHSNHHANQCLLGDHHADCTKAIADMFHDCTGFWSRPGIKLMELHSFYRLISSYLSIKMKFIFNISVPILNLWDLSAEVTCVL